MFNKLFGGGKKDKPKEKKANIDDTLKTLDKKLSDLELLTQNLDVRQKNLQEEAKQKLKAGDKAGAKRLLAKKKKLLEQLKQTEGAMAMMEEQKMTLESAGATKEIFDTLISAFHKTKNIKKVSFSKINKVFVNLKEKKTKKEKLNNITSIFKKNSKLEPLYHKLKMEEKLDKVLVLHKDNRDIGDLFEVKFKIYNYLNQKDKIIKIISKPIEKKFIKQIEKQKFDGQFQKNCSIVEYYSASLGFISFFGACLSMTIPPLSLGSFAVGVISFGILDCTYAAHGIKDVSEYYSNKEFNEQKVIEELQQIEEDF